MPIKTNTCPECGIKVTKGTIGSWLLSLVFTNVLVRTDDICSLCKSPWQYNQGEHRLDCREGYIILTEQRSNRFEVTGYRFTAYPSQVQRGMYRCIETVPSYMFPPMKISLKKAKMVVDEWMDENDWHMSEQNEQTQMEA